MVAPSSIGRPLIKLDVDLGDSTPLARATNEGMFDLSPDGGRLAVTLRGGDGKKRPYTRLLYQSQATPLAGTENASYPFFSPDGKWIGFFVDGKLKKISVEGGAAVTLCDAPNPPRRELGRRWQYHRGEQHWRPLAGSPGRWDAGSSDQADARRT